MLVVTRHRPDDVALFLDLVQDAFAALAERPGFSGADLARSVEDRGMYLVAIRWADAGAYRRSLSPIDTRVRVLPLYSSSVDADGVFELLYEIDAAGTETVRDSDLADEVDRSIDFSSHVDLPPSQ